MAGKRRSLSEAPAEDDSGAENASPLKRPRIEHELSLSRSASPVAAQDVEANASGVSQEDESMDAEIVEEKGDESGEDDEAEEDEQANMEAYNALKAARATQNRVIAVKEAGYLKRIGLIDFMCHRNFTFEFAPKMNGIVGHNGSGKSAILTAIAIALGGQSKATGRGLMRDSIRNGADKAVITLVIANGGPDALEPEKYGNEIIIERIITKTSSPYRVKSSIDGRIIGSKRDDVISITNSFNITVDSPLTILTQDSARGFLQSADEHKLYMLFTEGTGLQSLAEEYARIRGQIDYLKALAKKGREALPEIRIVIENYKRQLESSIQIQKQKEREKFLKAESAWAYVIEKEGMLAEDQDRKAELEEKIVKATENLQRGQNELAATDAHVADLQTRRTELAAGRAPLEADVKKCKGKIANAEKHFHGLEDDQKDNGNHFDAQKKLIARQQTKLDKQISQMNAGPGQKRIQDQKMVANYLGFLKRAPAEEAGLKDVLDKALRAKADIQGELDGAKDQVDAAQGVVDGSAEHLRLMQTNQKDRLAAFGHNVRAVLAEIEKVKWRGPKPVGPLGLYVRLENMKWRDVLQRSLGNVLCTWACQNPADTRTMVNLLQSCAQRHGYRPPGPAGRPPPVITNSGDIFDYSEGDKSSIGETVLKQLRFEGEHAEYVKRVLINRRIEQIFLSDNSQAARREIDRVYQITHAPVMVWTADGYTADGTPGGYGSNPVPEWRAPPIFIKDYAADIDILKARMHEEQKGVQTAEQAVRALKVRMSTVDNEIKVTEKKMKDFKVQTKVTKEQLEAAQDRLAKEPADELSALQDIKQELENGLQSYEDQFKALEAEMVEARRRIGEHQAELKGYQANLQGLVPQSEANLAELQTYTNEHAKLHSENTHWTNNIKRYRDSIVEIDDTIDKAQVHLAQALTRARELREERIETTRHWKKVLDERKAIKNAIEDAEKTQGFNYDEVQRELHRANTRYRSAEMEVKEFGSLATVADQALKWREEWWKNIRKSHAIFAKCGFSNFLSKRNMEGMMELDHKTEKMTLRIRSSATADGDGADEANGATQSKGQLWRTPQHLSGGERSFCTVSLLLALWECMDSPLCCLDEWDVFLDAANRAIAGNMLLECARDGTEKQFILITPQDLGTLKFGAPPLNKSSKMPDPERGQTTLPFRPAAITA